MFTSILAGSFDLCPPGAPWMVCLSHFDGFISITTGNTTNWVYMLLSGRFQWSLYKQVNIPNITMITSIIAGIFDMGPPEAPWMVCLGLVDGSIGRPLPIGFIRLYGFGRSSSVNVVGVTRNLGVITLFSLARERQAATIEDG